MSNQAPKLRVRFHGRFVFVTKQNEETKQKELIVLAVNMDAGKRTDDPNLHNLFMTVREQNVKRDLPSDVKEREPSYRLFGGHVVPTLIGEFKPNRAGNLVPYDGANLAWNIAQCDVRVEATGRFDWLEDTDFELADFAKLAPGKKVDEKYLQSVKRDPKWATTAIIRLRAGEGRVYHELPAGPPYNKDMFFEFERRAEKIEGGCLADLVEVTIPLPEAIDVKFMGDGSIVRLKRTVWRAPTEGDRKGDCPPFGFTVPDEFKHLTKEIEVSSDVVLAFSNLCTTSTNDREDREFADLYEVLIDPPLKGDRFIPVLPKPEVGPEIRFMGDCYLAAKIDSLP